MNHRPANAQPTDYVFRTRTGNPLDGNNIRERSFAQLCERAGLPHMRFHALRHSAATLLMSEDIPMKQISEMLGHADVTTTMRIYAHTLPASHKKAAMVMDRMLGGGVGSLAFPALESAHTQSDTH